jgi:hypothetical protein
VRADGYDADGSYWGAGPDVFIGTSSDGAKEYTVRASSAVEARRKIEVERKRPVGTPPPKDNRGGRAPSTARYEFDWKDAARNVTLRVRVTHARDYLAQGHDHIEVQSIAPKKAPLPITETGYRSHFLSPLELINAGGPVPFVTRWLDHEASKPLWTKASARHSQGDLFQWAADREQVASAQPKRPAPKPERSSKPKRQYPG